MVVWLGWADRNYDRWMIDVRWLQAVLDLPAEQFDVAAQFWAAATNTTRGEVHRDHDEFVHLLPPSGAMHLELQRIEGGASAHLDLLVDNIDAATKEAKRLGATLLSRPGHSVLTTPGGVPFCIVPYSGEAERAPLIDAELPHAVDQICLDIPHEHFEVDIDFWAALTGWEPNPARLPEFRSFAQPKELPLRVLLQQLGTDDEGVARAHIDVSSGDHVTVLTDRHESAGATVLERLEYWTALNGPAGMPYCLTSREPTT